MGTYVQISDVASRIGGREISSTTSPSTADVDSWINQAEAELVRTLAAVGGPATYTGAGADTISRWVSEFVAGLVRNAHAAAAGSGNNDDGKWLWESFEKRIKDIRADPDYYVALLNEGAASTSQLLSSHTTSGVSTSYDPVFTTAEGF